MHGSPVHGLEQGHAVRGGGRARPRLRAQPEDGEGGRSSGRLRDHGASPARLAQAFLL